jgi:CBS domain-containing protein
MLKKIINNRVVTVEPETKVADVARKMSDENIGAILVCDDDGKPRGIVTDRDIIIRCVAKNVDVNDCTVEQILSEPVETINETDGLFDCIQKMNVVGVRRMPVVDQTGKVIGVVSFGDLIDVLSRELTSLAEGVTPASKASKDNILKAA